LPTTNSAAPGTRRPISRPTCGESTGQNRKLPRVHRKETVLIVNDSWQSRRGTESRS
jgi:hypothetical protein